MSLSLSSDDLTTWPVLASAAALLAAFCWSYARRRRAPAASPRARALILVGTPHFPLPAVAQPFAVFTAAGVEVTLCSARGGATQPDPASLQTEVAQAAAAACDPCWLQVLETVGGGLAALPQLRAERFDALFVAGGAGVLRELRETDLRGRRLTPFCLACRDAGAQLLARGGVVGATGHGVLALPQLSEEEKERYAGRYFAGALDSAAPEVAQSMLDALQLGEGA
ncbi:hypothetical protein AB1Y20_005705 [Prymnesium parvum]|uniref:DJ-1/PfpI domain-containing protein n=1 Tax=Prymnesium parvum TaxID=97485 RepID=A0AB34J047_PRYPA